MTVVTAETELERFTGAESLLQTLVNSLPAFISYINSEQRYVFANALYASFFGKDLSEIIGFQVADVFGYDAYQKVREHLEAALIGERQSYEYDMVRMGKTRHLRVMYIPHVVDSKVRGIFVFGLDITQQRENELQLYERIGQTVKMLERLKNCPLSKARADGTKSCVIPEIEALIENPLV